MLVRVGSVLAAVLMVTWPCAVWASPTINGTVGAGEYNFSLADTLAETAADFYNTGLDIKVLSLTQDATGTYLGLTVVASPLATGGSPDSLRHETDFWAVFRDATGTTDQYLVDVLMNGAGVETVTLKAWDALTSSWDVVPLVPGDYLAAVGSALEVWIAPGKMPGLAAAPWVGAQLDGTGSWADDQITGVMPEPATLSLMGLGAVVLAWARRRR